MGFKMFDYECQYCGHNFEALRWNDVDDETAGDPKCPKCGDPKVLVKPTFAGYNIYGDNSASQRPKSAGSFKRGKK